MKSLTNNTLEDISKYSNKTFKLVNYLSKSEQPIILSELIKVSQMSDNISLLEGVNKDINATVNMYEKAHVLLSVVDDNDCVSQLKGPSDDLKVAFEENYNAIDKSINIGGITIPLRKPFNKEQVKEHITQHLLGISKDDFREIFKKRKEIYRFDEDALADDVEGITFLSIVKDRDQYKKIIDKIKDLHNGYMLLRASMDEKDKRKIDQEITFSRSMVDSITQQSTFIEKDKGFVQISTQHKKKKDLLKILELMLKQSRYIKAIELDKDTSLENTLNVLKQMKDLKLNLSNEIVFKVRKLGNYNASGIYLNSQKIVAVDISEPASIIYELCHAMDVGDKELFTSDKRKDFVNHFKHKVVSSLNQSSPAMSSSTTQNNYYYGSRNIISRLGEVAYLFQKYHINEHRESIQSFINRVKNEEDKEDINAKGLSMSQSMEYMTDPRREALYFDLKSWTTEDISLCKHFYAHFFNVDNEQLHEITKIPVFHGSSQSQSKNNSLNNSRTPNTQSRYQKTPVSFMNEDNIEYLLNYNKEHKVVGFDVLLHYMTHHMPHISRTRKTYNNNVYRDQIKTWKKVGNWLDKNINDNMAYQLLKDYVHLLANAVDDKHYYYIQALKDGHEDDFNGSKWLEEENKKIAIIEQERKEFNEKFGARERELNSLVYEYGIDPEKRQNAINERVELWNKKRDLEKRLSMEKDKAFAKTITTLKSLYKGFSEDRNNRVEYLKIQDGSCSSLSSGSIERFFHPIMSSVVSRIKDRGWSKILRYDSQSATHNIDGKREYLVERMLPMFSTDRSKLSILFQADDYKEYIQSFPQMKGALCKNNPWVVHFEKDLEQQNLFGSKSYLDVISRKKSRYGYGDHDLNQKVHLFDYVKNIFPEVASKYMMGELTDKDIIDSLQESLDNQDNNNIQDIPKKTTFKM